MSSDLSCAGETEAVDLPGMVRARRDSGDHRFDPVRFRFIEALASRAAAHRGEARRLLDDKVIGLLAAYGEDLARARSDDGPSAATAADRGGPLHRGALAELVDAIARRAPEREEAILAGDGAPSPAPYPELKTLRYFRRTWSRLSAERRLSQSLAQVPENAGPLHSQRLLHRSLALMQELSPEYLQRFLSYVDVLQWLDQTRGERATAAAPSPRAEGGRKARRSKP